MQGSARSGSTYFLVVDRANESTSLWADCTNLCESHPVIRRPVNSLTLLSVSNFHLIRLGLVFISCENHGGHCIAFSFSTQQSRVRFSALPKNFGTRFLRDTASSVDGVNQSNEPIWYNAGIHKSTWGLRKAGATKNLLWESAICLKMEKRSYLKPSIGGIGS